MLHRLSSTLLLLSPSTILIYSLIGSFLFVKIVRSWLFRGCLLSNTTTPTTTSGGGEKRSRGRKSSNSNTTSSLDDNHNTVAVGDISARLRSLAISSRISLAVSVPIIKLVPLENDISSELERVMMMANNNNNDDDEKNNGTDQIMMDVDHENDSMIMKDDTHDATTAAEGEEDPSAGGGEGGDTTKNAIEQMVETSLTSYSLDCYPYTFSPLLLFTNSGYFDRGYSNYNAVAAFFAPALRELGGGTGDGTTTAGLNNGIGSAGKAGEGVAEEQGNNTNSNKNWTKVEGRNGKREHRNSPHGGGGRNGTTNEDMAATSSSSSAGASAMDTKDSSTTTDMPPNNYDDGGFNMLHSVIYDNKNLTYDELFHHIIQTSSIVTCCIDAHFTAFPMLNKSTLLYYDPLQPSLLVARTERDVHLAALYLLMKCHYGDNAHIHENEKYYTAPTSSRLQNQV